MIGRILIFIGRSIVDLIGRSVDHGFDLYKGSSIVGNWALALGQYKNIWGCYLGHFSFLIWAIKWSISKREYMGYHSINILASSWVTTTKKRMGFSLGHILVYFLIWWYKVVCWYLILNLGYRIRFWFFPKHVLSSQVVNLGVCPS